MHHIDIEELKEIQKYFINLPGSIKKQSAYEQNTFL